MSPDRGTVSAKFDLAPTSDEQLLRLTSQLNDEQREVLLDRQTEAPFCGSLLGESRDGAFTCRMRGLPLFRSGAEFESGTGWPTFTSPFPDGHLRCVSETSFRMVRTEVSCARFGSHQDHVFSDLPPPDSQRHCINSVSLEFTPQADPLPDKLGRGAPEGVLRSLGRRE